MSGCTPAPPRWPPTSAGSITSISATVCVIASATGPATTTASPTGPRSSPVAARPSPSPRRVRSPALAEGGGSSFFSATFENWQSELLQLFSMVVLTAYLIHRGSHESKDQDEEVDQTLARIERRLERIEQAQGSPAGGNGANMDDRRLV